MPRRLRVVHVITGLDIGGAELTLAQLLEKLDPARNQSFVVSLSTRGPITKRIENTGVPVFAFGMQPGKFNGAALWKLVRLLRRLNPDLVQTWLYHADLAGLIAGKLARVSHVIWNLRCAELDPRDHPRSLPAVQRVLAFLSTRPSVVVCNSEAGRRAHECLGYKPRRWSIIPNGIDAGVFRPCVEAARDLRRELALGDGVPLVGLLARFHPMKDHTTFLQAAALVSRVRPDVHFVAAGRGVDDNGSLACLVESLELGDRVHLLPERHDAPRFLAGLDVAVSSSSGEAFPNVVGEAMACGIPCVVTNVGDAGAIVGNTGLLVPARAPEALSAGILRVLEMDAVSRDALGRAARRRIECEFSAERCADAYQRLYDELHGTSVTKGSICAG